MEVRQLEHKNQYVIKDGLKVTFQSYESEICCIEDKILYLKGNMWDYSNTTRKHFKLFVNQYTSFKYENKAQWLKEIATNPLIKVV